ncbi:MAG: amino acid synthesis family protein [Chloroflexota bacterium]|nr:amino acid synthesis family protein [Chloroflexota bacterium]
MDGVRVIVAAVQQTLIEAGAGVDPPTAVATAAISVRNPLAGMGQVADLGELQAMGRDAATLLVERALAVLASVGLSPSDVRGYGKGAIVGIDGDREHTAAVLHPCFGAPVRAAIGGGADIIPGTKKVGGPGASITMPIGNKDDRWVFDDMDAVDIAIPDAPRPDEIVIALVLSAGGRPNARVRKPA